MTTPIQNPYCKHYHLIHQLLINDPKVLPLERFCLICICLLLLLTPAMFIRWVAGLTGKRIMRKCAMDYYVMTSAALSLFTLFYNMWSSEWYPILSIVLLVDLFINLVAIVLLREFWRTPYSFNRTLISLGFNFVEYTGWFAGLYLHFDSLRCNGEAIKEPLSAYYFSIVTAVTVGFGDIVPTISGRNFVIIEILCSLLFLAIIVTYIMGNLNIPKASK